MRRARLSWRMLTLAMGAMLLASIAAVGTSGFLFFEQMTRTELARAQAIAAGLRAQLERLLALGIELDRLTGFEEQCLDVVRGNEGLSQAMVVGPDGVILFHNDPGRIGQPLVGTSLRDSIQAGLRHGRDSASDLFFAAEPIVQPGVDTAWIIVGSPIGRIAAQRDRLILIAVAVSAIAIGLCSWLLWYAIARFVNAPLAGLLSSIEHLRQRDNQPGQRLPGDAVDEFDQISTSFNRLLERVEIHESELLAAKELALAANKAKSAFLANMSHELRTPLNAVIGLTALAMRKSTDARIQDFLRKANQAGKQLLAVISDVLDLSRIEAQRLPLRPEPCAVAQLLRSQVALVRGQALDKGLPIEIDIDPSLERAICLTDGVRVGQILLNLLGNAIKFTERGRITARLRMASGPPDRPYLRFEVQDTGVGVDPRHAGRLFQPFEQADNSSTRHYGGAGLGLSICRQLVDMMDGRIDFDGGPGAGSQFWFEIPYKAVATAQGLPEAPPATGRPEVDPGARILLVEDEPFNRDYALELLGEIGLRADVAEDGPKALQRFQAQSYDLVLMDIRLPGMDGIEVTRRMRGMPHGLHTPIVALTANAFAEDRDACLAAGMNDFIPKPVDADEFAHVVSHWLPVSALPPAGGGEPGGTLADPSLAGNDSRPR